jgi:hypothetical protein
MGQGVAVPTIAFSPEMRASINKVLARLGYRIVDDGWQSAVGSIDPRADTPANRVGATGGDHVDGEVESAIRALRERLENGSAAMHAVGALLGLAPVPVQPL